MAPARFVALLAEVYHRVRNNLQVMVSLIGLYGRAAPDACRGSFEALGQRVRAIALVQQHLHEAPHIASIDLKEAFDMREVIARVVRQRARVSDCSSLIA